ncbi:malate dehydrogenase [Acidihalobacter ferrooxydans]|uniref:Malate dehydrogenase n=1 Tax=Acidihalobacter ferrooxydans TaxID=1765967 RepID=A0A1P8UIK8_9GAMM|nr:malate dehydrogenase [Acidihalobacter ferrooxydans]APZ43679.1 malate dehydrogenase [Acidihalobacter ferrooxydans]
MQKIAIVGAGRVGEAAAQFIAQNDMAREIAMLDVREGAAEGCALDIQETAPLFKFDTRLSGSTDPAILRDAGIIVVTAGIPRKPGMSRSDVLDTNVRIIDEIVDNIMRYAPDAILLFVSNPVDVLTWRAWKRSGLPRERVIGQAGVLDSSRMAAFVALETGLCSCDINAMVLGGHGDSMVPMLRYTTINGIPVDKFLDAQALERIVTRTRGGGAEVLALRKNSSAYDAPGAAVAQMVEAIVTDRKRVLPSVAILQGEYSYPDGAMGVPCVLGKNGLERIVELDLNASETAMFKHSMESVLADIARLH